jgi:hypothetical protein
MSRLLRSILLFVAGAGALAAFVTFRDTTRLQEKAKETQESTPKPTPRYRLRPSAEDDVRSGR